MVTLRKSSHRGTFSSSTFFTDWLVLVALVTHTKCLNTDGPRSPTMCQSFRYSGSQMRGEMAVIIAIHAINTPINTLHSPDASTTQT